MTLPERLKAKTAFAKFLDHCVKNSSELEELLISKNGEEIVIADVGSLAMPYGRDLYEWAEQYATPRIYAVDFCYEKYTDRFRGLPIHKIPELVEKSAHYFADDGISHVDLFTIFNPHPDANISFPDVTKLGSLSDNSLVLLTIDAEDESEYITNNFCDKLKSQGMTILNKFDNPYSDDIKSKMVFKYNPVIISRAPSAPK